MDYIRFAISNPVKVTVGVLLIVLFGVLALVTIPIQLVPDVDRPVISVETNWTGRSPQEVEREIIEEQEDKLKSLSNLKKMTATASQGTAEIQLEFYIGTDITRALQEVSDKLREVPEYPADVDEPVISASDIASENAIAWIILDSTDPNYNVPEAFDFADKRVKPYLERVSGISRMNIYGGREREVQVRINPHRLALRGITFNELYDSLRNENVNVSAGDLVEGRLDIRIRSVGQYDNLNDIRETVVSYTDGGPVRVKDIGDVILTLEKRRSFVRANGKGAMAVNAIRETGANVIEIMEGLRQRIDYVNENILPLYENDKYQLRLRQVYDETVYIDDAIDLVQLNLVIGGVLAGTVLLLFLRTIRPTVVIALAIPISVIGTFVAMTAFGRNLNVISLAGLSFAVGMVVDNAIVVLENIDRHLGMGQKPMQAAYNGAKEVWGAILASTGTTLAVFVPVLMVEEEVGQLFRDIALAICAAVALSLIISITVIPSASARWLRVRRQPTGISKAFKSLFGLTWLLNKVVDLFARFVYKFSGPGAVAWMGRIVIVAVLTVVAIFGASKLMPPATYLPSGNRNLIFGIMFTPPAYNLDHNEFIGDRVESGVRPYWEAETTEEATAIQPVFNFFTQQPYPQVPAIDNYFFVSFGGTIFMGCSSLDKELVSPLGSVLSGAMSSVPGAFGFAQQFSIFGMGLGGGNSIDVEIAGSDLGQLRQSAQAMYMALAQKFDFRSVRPEPLNFNLAGPEVQVRPDYVRSSELGINMSNLGVAVAALVDGTVIGDYRYEGDSIDLRLIRHPDVQLTADSLRMMPLAYEDRDGQVGTIPLGAIAQIVNTEAPQQIQRKEQLRSITLLVTPPPEIPLETAAQMVSELEGELRSQGQISPLVQVIQAGTADRLVQVRETLLGKWTGFNANSLLSVGFSRMFLALLITYLLMAALFESFLYPFVIMFSVPLATVGGFIGLALVRFIDPSQQLDMLTMLGFVILIGVVVNNAILLVHQALNFMRGTAEEDGAVARPHSPSEAIREAVRTRVRPIFMTTLTSVCGMAPLVLFPGSGSELYRGLGSVVVGGLIVSTVFTLLVVPLVFSIAIQFKAVSYRLFGWESSELAVVLAGSDAESTTAPQPIEKPKVEVKEEKDESDSDVDKVIASEKREESAS